MAQEVKLTFRIDAKTGALTLVKKGVDGIGDSAKRSGKKAKKAGDEWATLGKRIAGLVTIGATIRFFQSATVAAVKQSDAILRLNASLAETGEFTEESSQEIQKWAAALQDSTRIGDEVILQNFALAKSFVGTKDAARELIDAALDFSIGAGLNFEEALRRLGRATKGTTDDVSKFAPEIAKLTRVQLEAGEATRIMAERFRGAAAAQAAGLGGQLDQLVNKFSDLQEVIIQELGPAFKFWTELLGKATNAIKGLIKANEEANTVTGIAIQQSIERIKLLKKDLELVIANKKNANRDFIIKQLVTEDALLKNLIAVRKEEKRIAEDAAGRNKVELDRKLAREQELREFQAAIPKKKQFLNIELRNIQEALRVEMETRKIVNEERATLTRIAEQQERELVRKASEDGILTAEEFANKIIEIEVRRSSELRQIRNDELAHQKTILDQDLTQNETARRLALAEQELTSQERITLLEQSAAAAREIIRIAQEGGIIDAEEAARRLTEVENKLALAKVDINKQGNEDITKANESFAKKIGDITAGIAATGRQAFNALGDAVGKSFADALVDGQDFEKSFTQLWKNIKRQVIAQIVAMIVKLIALKAAKVALGGPFGAFFAEGGRTPSLGSRKPLRGLAGGGRTAGPEVAVIGEGPDDESIIPDSQAIGFALGALAAKGARLPRGLKKNGLDRFSRGSSSGKMEFNFGDINFNFTGPVNLDRPENIDIILDGMAQRLKDKTISAITTARLMGDMNEEESDRAV